jgi:thiol-disulfide isomerase/thioredoxin
MPRSIAILAAVLCLSGLVPGGVAAQDVGLPIGARVPALQLQDLDGEVVDLGQFIGRTPVLLEFWATWCSVCAALEPRLQAAQSRFGSQVRFVRVAVGVNQTARSIRRHMARHNVPGLMVFDKDGRATRAFEAPATSYVVLLDRQGRVAYTGIGEDQDLAGAIGRVLTGK